MAKTDASSQPKMLGANGFKYKPQYGVIIVCEAEADQQIVFNELRAPHKAAGRKIKVVTV